MAYPKLPKAPVRKNKRYSLIAANVALLAAVGLLVYLSNSSGSGPSQQNHVAALGSADENVNPLDEISSTDIAVNVSRVTRLDEATSVTNKADTESAQQVIASSDDKVIAKPQIVAAGLKSNKDIQYYIAKEGDTVGSIAEKFDVTSDTIRLSNGLDSDDVNPGQKLVISPVNGIVYTVARDDTVEAIASKYRANKDQLIAFNDLELSGLKPGEKIVIPDGLAPISSQYNYYSAGNPSGFAFGTHAQYGQNGYDYGWCTWHAANRRIEIGRPIPSNMGNAISWLGVARSMGLPTGSEPREGAVVYFLNMGGMGHVAFVEQVNPDGSFRLSQMNNPYWGRVTYDDVPVSEVGNYRFIY